MKRIFTLIATFTFLLANMLHAQTIRPEKLATKGPLAQAFSYYDGPLGENVHIEFDVDNFTATVTKKSDFDTKLYAGEFYMGTWYANDDDNTLYAFDAQTSEYTTIATNEWVTEMAYDYTTNTMYGMKDFSLYDINLQNGVYTKIGTLTGLGANKLLALAIDLNGNMYGVSHESGIFYSINKSNLHCTSIGSTGLPSNLIQSMGFDHNTGILYWAQCGAYEGNHFCSIDVNTGAATILAENTGVMTGFFIPYIQNPDVPNAPTNAEVLPIGLNLEAELSWTNPTTSLGGNNLTSITKIIVSRNGEIIEEFDNPAPGEQMSYTDNSVPFDGQHYYVIYAENEHGEGKPVIIHAVIGDFCPVYLELFCTTNLSWEGSNITVSSNDVQYAKLSLEYGIAYKMFTVYVPSGDIDFTYNIVGAYNNEKYFKIYNANMELIYNEPISPTGPEAGLFLTYENNCSDFVGLEEVQLETLTVYPNPVHDILYFQSKEIIGNVSIYNLSGQIVKTEAAVNGSINLSELRNGIYFVDYQTEHGSHKVKIIKQ